MNSTQRKALQITAIVLIATILFPPLTTYPGHGFLFSLSPHMKISFFNLLMRAAAISLCGVVAYLHFGQHEHSVSVKTFINFVLSYYRGQKSLSKTFWLVTVFGSSMLSYITVKLAPTTLSAALSMQMTQGEVDQLRSNIASFGVHESRSPLFILTAIMLSAYIFWALISTWRAASFCKKPLTKYVTQGVIVFIWLFFFLNAQIIFEWAPP